MASLFDLSGRTALVTGSSRGLGHAIARGLGQAGARLVLNGTDAARVAEAASRLRGEGLTVAEAPFDVCREDQVAAAFARLDEEGIAVDILVNNAGVQHRAPMVELTPDAWRRVIETNLTSAFLVAREAARRMIGRGGGKIVNIGSVMSELARPTVAPYTAAKGGIRLLTRSMAAEWAAHDIQANAIGPGYMLTDMNAALIADPDFDAFVRRRTPAARWGRPEELVGAAVFLSSAASNYVNGQMIFVDGGITAVL